MTRDQILDFVARWRGVVDTRDVDRFVDLYTETAELHSPLAGAVTGHDGVRKSVHAFFSAFPDVVFAFEPPIIDGNRVAQVALVSGTHVGGFLGLAPTGKPFKFTIVFVLEIAGGQIVREQRIYDFTGLLVQIGVLKAKPV